MTAILSQPEVRGQSEARQTEHSHDDLLRHSGGKSIGIAVDNRDLYDLETNHDQPGES